MMLRKWRASPSRLPSARRVALPDDIGSLICWDKEVSVRCTGPMTSSRSEMSLSN